MTLLHLLLLSFVSMLFGSEKADIVFAGDAMQHKAQIDAASRGGGVYDYSDCFKALSPYISDADYAVVNLETPLGGEPYSGYPCFSAPDSYLDALTDAGFDMMLTANNHTLDKRDRGLVRTLDKLDERNVTHLGTYRNAAERDSVLPMIVDIAGFKVGFLNYTYGTNGITLSSDAVVDYIDRDKMARDIARTRSCGAELVAVCVHWGLEYQLLPSPAQRQLADFLVEQGVDMIIGGHPHVIQPMEMRRRADGSNVVVVYSLGNFISNMKTVDTRGGAMVKVNLERDDEGRAHVASADYRLVFTVPPSTVSGNFRLVPAEICTKGDVGAKCKAFTQSAERIFNKHNIGIGRDTVAIRQQKMTPLEKFLRKTFGVLQK